MNQMFSGFHACANLKKRCNIFSRRIIKKRSKSLHAQLKNYQLYLNSYKSSRKMKRARLKKKDRERTSFKEVKKIQQMSLQKMKKCETLRVFHRNQGLVFKLKVKNSKSNQEMSFIHRSKDQRRKSWNPTQINNSLILLIL